MKDADQEEPGCFKRQVEPGNHSLLDKETNLQGQFDNEFLLRPLDAKEPDIHNRQIDANPSLAPN
jgi:hypothetical protein